MSKERLKSIKRKTVYLEGTNYLMMAINTDDYRWLIKQAERVQVLENKLENVMDRYTYLEGIYYDIRKRYKHYREAIAQLINYIEMTDDDVDQQVHKIHVILDKTLEGEE